MPAWRTLKRYLDRNGWINHRTTDHYHYKKIIDGEERRIKCSMGSGEISSRKWQWILKHELKISQEEFNAGL